MTEPQDRVVFGSLFTNDLNSRRNQIPRPLYQESSQQFTGKVPFLYLKKGESGGLLKDHGGVGRKGEGTIDQGGESEAHWTLHVGYASNNGTAPFLGI